MSRKNFKVATTTDGKTTLTKIDKTPTGKVKTLKDREKIRKEREEQYKNFRVNALKRRAKRMKLTEEQTKVAIDRLLKQMSETNNYHILIMFHPDNYNLIKQALLEDDIAYDILSKTYGSITGDDELLKDLREILPPDTKIYPYVKKKPPVLPTAEAKPKRIKKYTKAQKKKMALEAKNARKAAKDIKSKAGRRQAAIAARKEAKHKAARKAAKAKMLFEKRCKKAAKKAQNAKGGTTVQLTSKKSSTASKKASTTLKNAA